MEETEFKNACYEVLEILTHVKREELNKIPKEEIQLLRENANYNHSFKYNPEIDIKEQHVSKLAKGIIAIYFEKYLASDKQKEKINYKRKCDLEIIEQEKRKKYNPDKIFENTNINSSTAIEEKKENEKNTTEIIEFKQPKWYERIFSFIKRLFKK